ncbi:MAG: class II fructose-bisphosphate aldolase, partial [Synergistaceae bacterium]|nr:class II fructose-bisphosphate aldolase [Synergistaceae bacterium]
SNDYRKLNLLMCDKILAEPKEILDRINDEMVYWAERFIDAFGAEGSAEAVAEIMANRPDQNAAPDRKILGSRADFTADNAPNRDKGEENKDE